MKDKTKSTNGLGMEEDMEYMLLDKCSQKTKGKIANASTKL